MPPSLGPSASSIAYLDNVSASAPGGTFKRELLRALDLRAGHTVLDVGCGPGGDLAPMAERVTATGRVIGIDVDAAMCKEARRRLASLSNVDVCRGDAQALPMADGSVDRAHAERVLMHVAEPARVAAELRRVIRPRGLVTLAEPDWATLVVDHPDQEVSRTFTRFATTRIVRHGSIGRQLARLCLDVGFEVRVVTARTTIHRDFSSADAVWGLDLATERAMAAGCLDERSGREWMGYLRHGHFLGAITIFVVVAQAPS
jgi:cyclopropane fatty-acyl-phospholipid synthase-like methyltransferase